MTREEIREGIASRCFENCDGATLEQCDELHKQYGNKACWYCGADQVLHYLHSQGVVIKVARELPLITLQEAEEHDAKWSLSNFTDSLQGFGKKAQKNMLKDGYEAVESLIEPKEERKLSPRDTSY